MCLTSSSSSSYCLLTSSTDFPTARATFCQRSGVSRSYTANACSNILFCFAVHDDPELRESELEEAIGTRSELSQLVSELWNVWLAWRGSWGVLIGRRSQLDEYYLFEKETYERNKRWSAWLRATRLRGASTKEGEWCLWMWGGENPTLEHIVQSSRGKEGKVTSNLS